MIKLNNVFKLRVI